MILVRPETTPDDIHGLIGARGILTARGGMASHAAVVARGMGKPCVAGCAALESTSRTGGDVGGRTLREGEVITVDGTIGRVILGAVDARRARTEPGPRHSSSSGRTSCAGCGVRANADTPVDAQRARQNGAEGIGLCRTEHMFMAEDRLPIVRAMILADDETGARGRARRGCCRFQQGDFEGLFEAMEGLPVTIRLLDPPLHEFLPPLEEVDRRADARARARAARGEPDARHARLPARPRVAGDLRDADPRDRACGARRSRSARAWRRRSRSCTRSSRSTRSSHRLRELTARTVAEEARLDYPLRHDDRAAARRACAPASSRGTPTSSRSARTT